jgi:phytoene desaturase
MIFMMEAQSNYNNQRPCLPSGVSPLELTIETAKKVNFFSNISRDVRKKVQNEQLIQILEFPVLFLEQNHQIRLPFIVL